MRVGGAGIEHYNISERLLKRLCDPSRACTPQKGFMRVGLYGAMAANCSRVQVHRLGQSKEGKELLDVGVYQNRHWKVKLKTVGSVRWQSVRGGSRACKHCENPVRNKAKPILSGTWSCLKGWLVRFGLQQQASRARAIAPGASMQALCGTGCVA